MTSSQDEIRVVLIGKTGNGKSSLGNSLVHSRSAFYATQASQSVTKSCISANREFTDQSGRRKKILVVDTPGFFDTNKNNTNESVGRKIGSEIFDMTAPGVHAFLIVLGIGRFSPEEQETVNFIKKIFGDEAERYCIIVFTREDQLDEGQTLAEFIDAAGPELKGLIQRCGNRAFGISNKFNGDKLEKKTNQLIQMIDKMVRSNGGNYYTNDQYERIVRQREAEKRKREEEERRKKKAEEDAIAARVREEERKKQKAEKDAIAARIREEEKKKREQLEREFKEKLRISEKEKEEAHRSSFHHEHSRRDSCDGNRGRGNMLDFLGDVFGGRLDGGFQPALNYHHATPVQRIPSASSSVGNAHGGRFTGEYMATNGSANGRPIYEGARGGQYYMTRGGHRSYI